MKIISYKDLNIWKRSIKVVEEIYKMTKNFPKEEIYGLTSSSFSKYLYILFCHCEEQSDEAIP